MPRVETVVHLVEMWYSGWNDLPSVVEVIRLTKSKYARKGKEGLGCEWYTQNNRDKNRNEYQLNLRLLEELDRRITAAHGVGVEPTLEVRRAFAQVMDTEIVARQLALGDKKKLQRDAFANYRMEFQKKA